MKVLVPASKKDAETQQYVLTGNKHFGRNAKGEEVMYEKGDLVPLTAGQFEAFRDKFEEPSETQARAEKAKAQAAKQQQQQTPEEIAAAKKAADDAAAAAKK